MITHTIESYWISKRALHATHLLKLLDKMCKYEMDPMSIVEDTERTRFCPQTDRWTDGQGDTSIPPFNFVEAGGIINRLIIPSRDATLVVWDSHNCLIASGTTLKRWVNWSLESTVNWLDGVSFLWKYNVIKSTSQLKSYSRCENKIKQNTIVVVYTNRYYPHTYYGRKASHNITKQGAYSMRYGVFIKNANRVP